jgi:hypothetical protein
MAGLPCASLHLDERGAVNDRRFMLVDDSGCFLTQRQLPLLVLFQARIEADGLFLHHPSGGNYHHTLLTQETCFVDVWDDRVLAFDQGDGPAHYLSGILGRSVRLVFQGAEHHRQIDTVYAKNGQIVSFADGFPLLLTSESSLEVINRDLGREIAMIRFRPNLVISGALPFAEDAWRAIRIGSRVFELAKPCSRCAIPTINPQSGRRERDVFDVLKRTRKAEDGEVYFGQNLLLMPLDMPQNDCSIVLGAKVEVLA